MKRLELFSIQWARSLSGVLILALLAISAFGQVPETHAATRIALVSSGRDDSGVKVLDLTTALLGKDADL